jgi:quercetin dioxygenase-like cupin family protein
VVAATKLPTVTDVPLHFRVVTVTLAPGEKSGTSAANGVLYQVSGSTEVSLGGEAKTLNAGEGLFIAGGKTAELKAGGAEPSTFLHSSSLPPRTWIGLPRRRRPPSRNYTARRRRSPT